MQLCKSLGEGFESKYPVPCSRESAGVGRCGHCISHHSAACCPRRFGWKARYLPVRRTNKNLNFVRKQLQFSDKTLNKHADSIDAAILDRIRSGLSDRVWMPADFLDLGPRAAVDKALSRNSRTGQISRAGRGMYHLPRHDPLLGVLGPSYNGMQDFIRRKAQGQVFPTGAHAANALGLSDQVPVRSWHFTTGPNRRIRRGKSEIVLRHVSPRFVNTRHPKSALVILALRWIGKRFVDDDILSRLRRNLSPDDRVALLEDAACAPARIADIFRRLASDPVPAGPWMPS